MRSHRRVALSAIGGAIGLALAIPSTALADPAADGFTPTDARPNPDLTALFDGYGDTSGTWSGADSAYSVPLPDGTTAWLYSDTFIGPVNPDHSRDPDTAFVHNSINVVDGTAVTTHTGGSPAAPESLVHVEGADESADWYWFGDGTVEDDHLRVLLVRFVKTGPDIFDFAFAGSAVASFRLADMALTGMSDLGGDLIQWGSAIMEDGETTYVYGIEDYGATKYIHVARVPAGQLTDPAAWTYWNGTDWTSDQAASTRIVSGVSNELSVHRYQGRYTLVAQDATAPLSTRVVALRSDSPTGPFDPPVELYSTPETGGNIFTYNAKAHPQLGDQDTLVVSYNVNSFDTDDVYTDVDNYRPRYLTIDTRANAQLTIELGPETEPLVAGERATLVATVANATGVDAAPATTLTNTLPAGLEFVSATHGGTYDPGTRTVSWPGATIAAGGTLSEGVTVRVEAGAGTTLVDRATIRSTVACATGCTAEYSALVTASNAPTGSPTPETTASTVGGSSTNAPHPTAAATTGRLATTGNGTALPALVAAAGLVAVGGILLLRRRFTRA